MKEFVYTSLTPWIYELKYDLLRQFRCKCALVITIIVYIGMYASMIFILENNSLSEWYHVSVGNEGILLLIGYTYWQFSSYIINTNAMNISGEFYSGILESKLLTKSNFIFLMFARAVSNLVICLFAQLFVVIFACLFHIISVSDIFRYLLILVNFLPAMLGIFGWAIVLGGVALQIKGIGPFMYVIVGGMLVVSSVYTINSNSVQYLFPYTLGIDISRKAYLGLHIGINECIEYIGLNIFYLIAGIAGFKMLLKRTKKNGYFSA